MIRAGRKEPYTLKGISRLRCVRCGERAQFQWNACADRNLWRPLCAECDIGLNEMALKYVGDPDADEKIGKYAALVRSGGK